MRKEVLIVIGLLVLTIPAVRALFIPGGFTSHDLTHHVVRQISMDRLLSEGQFPPRWSGDLNNGYGYPLFLFNYPLPSMVGELFHLVGLGYVDSVKAVLFTSMVISVLGMYLFLRSLLGSSLSAFLGAVFYLYAPIRFLNVYVSAAVGSALALGILPFVFWSLLETSKARADALKNGKKWAPLVGGVGFAGLILAHNVTALIFTPVILIFLVVCSRLHSNNNLKIYYSRLAAMFLLGLGLSAWFWMPALFEKQYTIFDQIYSNFYKDQFVTLWQLIRSPWGYGLSHPQRPESGDMSYQIGLIHIGVMLVLSSWFVVRGWKKKEGWIGVFTLATFTTSIFLMLKISQPIWESLPFLSLIQFPLRFQAWSVFSASIAAALLVKYLPLRKMVFVILLGLVIYANRNHWNINQVYDLGEDYYLNLKTTSTSFGEHLPKWGRVVLRPASRGEQAQGKLEFVEGPGEVRVVRDKSAHVLAEVEASTAGQVRLNQFYFPGWEIKVDGKKANLNYLSDGESYGMPVFDIDSGKHIVRAEFKSTPIRNLGDGISIITVIIVILYLCKLLPRIL